MIQKKPYQIIPKLIEQPTWGGNYISAFKNLHLESDKKIGQSYELSGSSPLVVSKNNQMILSDVAATYPKQVLGERIWIKYKKMPLLIKFTQSLGNSFQLHIREKDISNKWKPKPESWCFFEEGMMTLGVNPKTDIDEYKNVCLLIEKFMVQLGKKIHSKQMRIDDAKKKAFEYIQQQDPYRFVNKYRAKRGLIVDLSKGGIHHSWEKDQAQPLGNIVYEVQLDVDDATSTLRSFDKGNISKDGSIRPLTIQDYFFHINTSPEDNLFSHIVSERNGERILQTNHYCLDEIRITKEKKEYVEDSFVHLFIKEGSLVVSGPDGELRLKKGSSCFIPHHIKNYSITPLSKSSTLLKTHILI